MPSLSPDGRRLAVSIAQNSDFDIWISDLARGTLTRLTFGGINYAPLWTADGKRVVFRNSSATGKTGIFWAPADGSGSPEQLLSIEGPVTPMSWVPDSSALLFYAGLPPSVGIWLLPSPGAEAEQQKPYPLFPPSSVPNIRPQLSPDGKWVVYDSTETGVRQVYVRPFPGPGAKIPISTAGGESARWARTGRELFYREGDKMMAGC
jgi:serine/threonine-protein kinase